MSVLDLVRALESEACAPPEALAEAERHFDAFAAEEAGAPFLRLLVGLKARLPLSPQVPKLLSRVHELLGNENEAESAEEDAARLSRVGPGHQTRTLEESFLVARLLFAADRIGDADRILRPLIRTHPDHLGTWVLWARLKHTQGQLTEAIRAYERVATLRPTGPMAQMRLEMIHRMSLLPEAPKRELDLIGDAQVARVNRAHMELERAFRLANKQQFTSAVELCTQLAERHQTTDLELYKLALLLKAAFLEGIAQFDGAIRTLEQLGSTRGFEADQDRLQSLARIYERRGTPEDLVRAAKVYDFLFERTRSSEFLSRQARIAEKRNDTADSMRRERLFLKRFHEEQLELTLEELLSAAVLYYTPLSRLRPLVPELTELELLRQKTEQELEELTGKEPAGSRKSAELERSLALLDALAGRRAESQKLWRTVWAGPASRPEDGKYLGDLADELGHPEEAKNLFLAALKREPVADSNVIARLTADNDPELDRRLADLFLDEDKRQRTYEALKDSAKAKQRSPGIWRALARFEALTGQVEPAKRHQIKADALARVKDRGGPRIGHVQVAAVYGFSGGKQGLVHEIWASRYPVRKSSQEGGQLDEGSIFGNVASDMMRDIQNVFVAVRTFVEQKFPHLCEDLAQYRYVLKVTKDDEPSGGNSAGIAVALAFVSVFLQKPMPTDFAITGSVVADSSSEIRVNRVADIDHKALAVYQRRMARLIAPAESQVDLIGSFVIPREVWEPRVFFAKNLTQVMKLVFGDDLWEW